MVTAEQVRLLAERAEESGQDNVMVVLSTLAGVMALGDRSTDCLAVLVGEFAGEVLGVIEREEARRGRWN